jgi:single-stranded-DNA-specific exonuclease
MFTRYGGHAHAVGFSLLASRLPELRAHLDQYARAHLTLADFEPTLSVDADLPLGQVTPELFRAVRRLEPFGVGNPEPVFAAHDVRMMAPPRVIKDKHVKLKLAATLPVETNEHTNLAVLVTPCCHPDAAVLRRRETKSTVGEAADGWRRSITFDALGWHMAERVQQAQLLPGDTFDIAYSLDYNDHPEFGGLELSLRDFSTSRKAEKNEQRKNAFMGS